MRRTAIILVLGAAALAGKREDRYLTLGRVQFARFQKATSNADRLKRLRKARVFFKKAKAGGVADLVKTLNHETGVYYIRKSLSLAQKRNAAALKLAPKDKTALRLRAAIAKAKKKDIYESVDGIVGINRVRARRLATGVPLRNRGRSRRR